MTLTDVIPTLRKSFRARFDGSVWPDGTTIGSSGDIVVGGVPLSDIVSRFGTACYVLDEGHVRARCRLYRQAMPGTEIVYAGTAFLCRAMVRWLVSEGLSMDVCSAGEIAIARGAGMPAEQVILHGNVKTPEDLKAAYAYEVGRIVVDSLDEIGELTAWAPDGQRVLVRVTPGIDAGVRPAMDTGVDDQKFGFPLRHGAAMDAVRAVLAAPNLRLVGLHCHIGAQSGRVADYELAARRLIDFMGHVRSETGAVFAQLSLGGGHVVPYRTGDEEFDVAGLAGRLRVAVNFECGARGLPIPRLTVEPARAVVAGAGVTVHRVMAVKRNPGAPTFVTIDGGMSDTPRTLSGARYTVVLTGRMSGAPDARVDVVGRHRATGDVLATGVALPSDVRTGDLLAAPVTGVYQHGLSADYDPGGRSPVIGVAGGVATALVRRETETDLLARDLG